ncbi:MAG: winged helix-turn-helix transcriptional regulator [Candidatus Lokiarchaeota archaeon]|nr:winged helix-turn-helix transcriptional regulator [Candidatus Lokiarchaeota archaeon]MBD3198835.1 winged helix-turn-helix transcriptional regulator [Candidatus Lokiarchaeota archaeon]
MDELDLKIILLLMNNSRLTYREISDYLDLSVNAIYKRVQNLVDLGIIESFTARLKPYAINAIYIFIFGQSNKTLNTTLITQLGEHEKTWQIIQSSRNYMYIGAMLEKIFQLEEYVQFVSNIAKIQSPNVGILSGIQYTSPVPYIVPRSNSMNYDTLDIEIIRSLHRDARKTTTMVADEVKSTPNTVRRRLDRLIKEGIIELSINFNPKASSDIFAVFQIETNPNVNKTNFAKMLNEKYHPNLFYVWTFSNLPNLINCWVWTNNMEELHEVAEKIKRENINSLIFDIMYQAFYFDTWKEQKLYE